ncbi:carbonic anhydrase family protein [bacterium]|nr:carbonic anhydrase family protein [bacterium]
MARVQIHNRKKFLFAMSVFALFMISGCASHEAEVKAYNAEKAHAAAENMDETSWGYSEKNGPAHWGGVSKMCTAGHHQSPVNIISSQTIEMNHHYDLSMAEDVQTMADVIDSGHAIELKPDNGGEITLNGKKFTLIRVIFHGKSEHTIDGKHYDMAAQLVHENAETKRLAVVAVFFEAGEKNALLDKVLANIGGKMDIDPQDLLPADSTHYYHYVGSMTTPPCSEDVQWYLLKEPVQASKEQIEAFRKYYVDNERPVQELYDREVESN